MIRLGSFFVAMLSLPISLLAFPLDGADETGIARLEGYRLAQQGKVAGNRLFKGAQLPSDQIELRLISQHEFAPLIVDAEFKRQVVKLLGNEVDNYSISLMDMSNPKQFRYVGHHADRIRNPGSVGKLLVTLAIFQTLADIYPDDFDARHRLLRESFITADEFIRVDHHRVPFWLPEKMQMKKRPLAEGDRANFWTYLDWSMSASSNAATSMVIKHLLLLRHFGRAYPVSYEQQRAYFSQTSRKQLREDLLASLLEPVSRNGMNPDRLRQGSFFTRQGKRLVPGTNSVCTTGELMSYLMLMEQGRLVDAWSSLQIKKLLYITQRRIRYASSPALKDAAVYFKSGSFYKCRPEEGFSCKKYQGNALNLMNSVAIVEAPGLYYMVAITSNVLRKNSAVAQQTLATRLHRLMQRLHEVPAAQK
jgi:hypothetical protein